MSTDNNKTSNPMRDKRGVWRTANLFVEYEHPDYPPMWTVYDTDVVVNGVTYPSLKCIYFSYDHVPGSEYIFAQEVLGSWEHWEYLCKSMKFSPVIERWRSEMDIKVRCEAVKNILSCSRDGTAAGANAAKWLVEKGYAPKRGRPSKAEKEGYLKQEEGFKKEIEEDLKRIGLRAV